MKAILAVLLVSIGICFAATTYGVLSETEKLVLFKTWMVEQNKSYASEEFSARFGIFKANLDRIDQLNAQNKAVFGINRFADLSKEEFSKYYLGTRAIRDESLPVAPLYSADEVSAIPTSWDWRTKGAVTPVKNQGQCGSCWSFSTTGNVEGQHFLSGKTLVGLSEQNLVDCDHECMIYEGTKSCDAGCDGGLMPNAFKYILTNGGIDTEASYPYQGEDGTCSFKNASIGATINNWTMVSENEDQMAAYLYEHGPLAIAADAVEWQFYIAGVFSIPCGTSLDHGILIVGYGTETDVFGYSIDYWIVKNSWGADWGESGYLRIIKGVGECGLNLFACSSIVDKN